MDEESIGTRLSRLCVRSSGQPSGLRFHDHGARAATLIDLVFLRRVSFDSTGRLVVSTTPTGHTAEDRMLAHVQRRAECTTADILAKAPVRMIHVSGPADEKRRWFAKGPWIEAHSTQAERQRLDRVAAADIDSPRTAALAMIADALRLLALTEPEQVLGECGEAAWMVEECVDYLRLVRYRFELTSYAASSGGGA